MGQASPACCCATGDTLEVPEATLRSLVANAQRAPHHPWDEAQSFFEVAERPPKTAPGRFFDADFPKGPKFAFTKGMITKDGLKQVMDYIVNAGLSEDPCSEFFLKRTKHIRFLTTRSSSFDFLERDYFIQNEDYNDFAGGYQRHFGLIPEEMINGPLCAVIRFWLQEYAIPEGTTILVQIQRTEVSPNSQRNSVTGQGIHTDGAARAAVACLEREGVEGAENNFHAALDSSQALCAPTVLDPGDVAIFKDNALYHYVSPAYVATKGVKGFRTTLIFHAPADHYLTGAVYENNNLGSNECTEIMPLRFAQAAVSESRSSENWVPEAESVEGNNTSTEKRASTAKRSSAASKRASADLGMEKRSSTAQRVSMATIAHCH